MSCKGGGWGRGLGGPLICVKGGVGAITCGSNVGGGAHAPLTCGGNVGGGMGDTGPAHLWWYCRGGGTRAPNTCGGNVGGLTRAPLTCGGNVGGGDTGPAYLWRYYITTTGERDTCPSPPYITTACERGPCFLKTLMGETTTST